MQDKPAPDGTPKPTAPRTWKLHQTRYMVLGPAGCEHTYDTHTGELPPGLYPPPAEESGTKEAAK